MILFKRVGDSFRHIEDREWVLLFLETLGVLIGILLAFELQEWASRRSDAAKHREIMERLFEESEQDVATLRDGRDFMRANRKNELAFVMALGENRCPAEPLWSAVNSIHMMPTLSAPQSVYQELMGAGGLSSIPDDHVRKAIVRFNAELSWADRQNDYFRSMRAQVIPLSDKRVRLGFDPKADEPEVAEYDRAALCNDRSFRNEIIDAVRNHVVVVSYHEGVTDRAIQMCGILGAKLGHQCVPPFGGPLAGDDAATLKDAMSKMRRGT